MSATRVARFAYEPEQGPSHAYHDKSDSDEITVCVVVGRTAAFFDFLVSAIASVLVFHKLVFPFVGPVAGTLCPFAVFAVAFVARPLGTLLFMTIDRDHGGASN